MEEVREQDSYRIFIVSHLVNFHMDKTLDMFFGIFVYHCECLFCLFDDRAHSTWWRPNWPAAIHRSKQYFDTTVYDTHLLPPSKPTSSLFSIWWPPAIGREREIVSANKQQKNRSCFEGSVSRSRPVRLSSAEIGRTWWPIEREDRVALGSQSPPSRFESRFMYLIGTNRSINWARCRLSVPSADGRMVWLLTKTRDTRTILIGTVPRFTNKWVTKIENDLNHLLRMRSTKWRDYLYCNCSRLLLSSPFATITHVVN